MNIFYLDNDPKICARFHCDKHVVKMVLEYCQLLSSAHRVLDGAKVTGSNRFILPDWREEKLYQVTHLNHPSTIWTRTNRANYEWLYRLLLELNTEYEYRYSKIHKSKSDGIIETLKTIPRNIPQGDFFEPSQAMPDTYKKESDSIGAYQAFYLGEKAHFLSWKNRPIPNWVLKAQ